MALLNPLTDSSQDTAELASVACGKRTANNPMAESGEIGATAGIESGEPPKLYLPACGALCDIFWWARSSS
jgi:hypothetical protein